jgi:hypothetical protein
MRANNRRDTKQIRLRASDIAYAGTYRGRNLGRIEIERITMRKLAAAGLARASVTQRAIARNSTAERVTSAVSVSP